MQKCTDQLLDATENLGDIEVLEALFAKAILYSRIGAKDLALAAFATASEKPQSIGQKIQTSLHLVRLGLFFSDLELVKSSIAQARVLIDEGGDWDRRNRLKVYDGCYRMMIRDFTSAATLFQESIATFTSTEIMSYRDMIYYCILLSVLCTGRMDLKTKIVDSPEILAVIEDLPYCVDFLEGFYSCQYRQFFQAMVDLSTMLTKDKYLAAHAQYIVREYRILAYSQFLAAYRSVHMDSMARNFGVSVQFLDQELSRFISAGKLNAKIDKVDGIIETNVPDAKNTQYQEVIQKGDLLLNRVQKLARVVNM